MADKVTFPCEYLIFRSGYDERLIEPEYIQSLNEFCTKHGVIPIGVVNPYYGRDPSVQTPLQIIPVRDGMIDLNAPITDEEQMLLTSLFERFRQIDVFRRNCIIFRVGNFQNATKVFLSMKDLDYCAMYDIVSIEFLANDRGTIDTVFVSVDAESG